MKYLRLNGLVKVVVSFAATCGFFGAINAAVVKPTCSGSAENWSMPNEADQIHLSWFDGPPQLQVFRDIDTHLEGFREDASSLVFRSQQWGMLVDPLKLEISRFSLNQADDAVEDTLNPQNVLKKWATSSLSLRARVRDIIYKPVMSELPTIEENYKYSPVQIIESGLWFQHVAVYDFELKDDEGNLLDAKSWFEIRAWGDKCILEWYVIPSDWSRVQLFMDLEAEGLDQSISDVGQSVRMSLSFDGGAVEQLKAQESISVTAVAKNDFNLAQPTVDYSRETDSWEVTIQKQDWPKVDGYAYNPDLLDRISNFDIRLENSSDVPRDICLRFLHNYHPIVGYVPIMLDAHGEQTGLPLQNSKNWHWIQNEPYPYEGSWINITARLTLEANSKVDLEYIVAHAQWQGVPASSAAQLSLVGWGYNGFWTQMALGSWGESVCIQPGRTMRRAFITDMRPFEVIGRSGNPYDWTSNVGGGDIGRVIGADGKFIPWVGSTRIFEMIGPNLSHVNVVERLADNSLRMSIDTFLPRSNSINRSYYKVKIEALKDYEFTDLALFQLGNDYYNEMESQTIGWGNADGLVGSAQPKSAEWGVVMEPKPIEGAIPWVSLYDNHPEPTTRGRAVRGIVIRDFKANIGDKLYTKPYVRAGRTMSRLNADVVLNPEVTRLAAGDTIEFLVEFGVHPFAADIYYGQNAALKQRLASNPDSWQLTAYEANAQSVSINGQQLNFPATYTSNGSAEQTIHLQSESSMDVVVIDGLQDPKAWTIFERVNGKLIELGQSMPAEAKPQISYSLDKQSHAIVLSLVFKDFRENRELVLKKR